MNWFQFTCIAFALLMLILATGGRPPKAQPEYVRPVAAI